MSKLHRLEENLETVKAYEAKCVERHQAALAESHEAEVQVDLAREAYVLDPTDSNAKAISKAREAVELAALRAKKPASELQDAKDSVLAAEQALETARQEAARIEREKELIAVRQTASNEGTDEVLDPQWRKLLDSYQAMIEAAQAIEGAFAASRAASETLRHEGIACPEATPLPNQYLFKFPVLERQQRDPIRGLVSDYSGGALNIRDNGANTNIASLARVGFFDEIVNAPGSGLSAKERKEELRNATEYFDRRCCLKEPEPLPPTVVGTGVADPIDPETGLRHPVRYETLSDRTVRRIEPQTDAIPVA